MDGKAAVLESRFSGERVERAEVCFEHSGFATIAIGAFAPIPRATSCSRWPRASSDSIRARTFWPTCSAVAGDISSRPYWLLALGDAARSLGEVALYGFLGVVALIVVGAYFL